MFGACELYFPVSEVIQWEQDLCSSLLQSLTDYKLMCAIHNQKRLTEITTSTVAVPSDGAAQVLYDIPWLGLGYRNTDHLLLSFCNSFFVNLV